MGISGVAIRRIEASYAVRSKRRPVLTGDKLVPRHEASSFANFEQMRPRKFHYKKAPKA